MNLFNRVVTTVVLLVVALTSVIVALAPQQVLTIVAEQLAIIKVTPQGQLFGLVVGVVIAIVCCLLIVAEVRRPATGSVALARLPEGVAEFATESIALKLKHEIESLPDVRLVTPKVVSRGGQVDVEVAVQTSPDVDVPDKTSEVYQAIRTNMDQMGLKLGKLRVNMRYSSYPTSATQKAR